MVTVDGEVLQQVMAEESLSSTPQSFWVDEDNDRLYLHVLSPPSEAEISVQDCLLSTQALSNLVLRNLTFTHGGSHLLGEGAVRFTEGEHLLIDQCHFTKNNGNALSLRGRDQTEGALTTTFGIHHVTLRDTTLNGNGIAGLETYALENASLSEVESKYNNWRGNWVGFRFGWVGSRLYRTHNALLESCYFDENLCRGLWFDYDNRDVTVRNSSFSHNRTNGMKFEVNAGPIVIENCQIDDNAEAGVTVTNTEGVSLVDCTLHRNRQSQIQIYSLEGHFLRDWESGASTTVYPRNWSVSGCSFENDASSLFWQTPDNTYAFWDTLVSEYNVYAAFSSAGQALFSVDDVAISWSDWQLETGSQILSLNTPTTESVATLAATEDLTLREDLPNDNSLGDAPLLTQVIYGNKRVTLINFDLTNLTDQQVSSATLKLTIAGMHDSGSTANLANEQHVIGIHAVTRPWSEQSTWDSTTGLPGSLYDPTPSDTVTLLGSEGLGTKHLADLSPLVSQWQSGELAPYGIAIVSTTGATDPFNYLAYRSSEWSIPEERPQLEITHTEMAPQQSYLHWQRGYFSAREITSNVAPPSLDPNHEGISYLAHYAWDTSPYNSHHQVFTPISKGQWSVRYPSDRSDLLYTLESSSNLTQWEPVAFPEGDQSVQVTQDESNTDQYKITITEPKFLRWNVIQL